MSALPVLPGVDALLAEGLVPGGTHRNLDFVGDALRGGDERDRLLVADPQTSGGLLVSCAASSADALVAQLVADGQAAAIIGEVTRGDAGVIVLDA